MKKKLLVALLLCIGLFGLTACKKTELNLNNYLIEDRQNLFVANDSLYNITLSTGLREIDYCFDGSVGEKTNFAILSLQRNDNKKLSNDNYAYTITINEVSHTGLLEKSEINNSYSSDLELEVASDATINVKISFTGYSFDQDLTNLSSTFNVDNSTALSIANEQLKADIEHIIDNNNKIEVVTKILADNSNSDINNYYWYIGVISSNGEIFGILIDTNTGEILAKKV